MRIGLICKKTGLAQGLALGILRADVTLPEPP